MNTTQTWYIVKRPAGHCEIVSSSTSEENDQAVQERWGPFNSNPKLWRVATNSIGKVPTDLGSGEVGELGGGRVNSSTSPLATSASIVLQSLVGWQSSASRLPAL